MDLFYHIIKCKNITEVFLVPTEYFVAVYHIFMIYFIRSISIQSVTPNVFGGSGLDY